MAVGVAAESGTGVSVSAQGGCAARRRGACPLADTKDEAKKEPLKVDGLHNLIYLAMIVGSVILSGILSKNRCCRSCNRAAPCIPLWTW
jgi:hypothetical protein